MSNYLDFDLPFILFNFSENDELENDFFKKFKYPQYISFIQDKYDPSTQDLNYQKILSYIWEKDCYYNERGNSSCYYSPANLLYKPSKGFIFCNILIIGESRSGKSTFINRLFNKYISYESSKFESTTKEINYYKYICSDNEFEENKLIKNKFGFIRVIDTPGLIHNTYAKIISELDEEFNNIHLIYFFMKGQSNIEQCINTLKYINDKNKEKIKNKAYKVPIIFIKNGEDLINGGNVNVLSKELKNVLKKNNLMDLYDNNFKKKDYLNDYNNYIDGNIIQIHLPTGKNLNKLFLISKNYILKNNSTILEGKLNDEYEIMEKNTNSLIKIYIKEKI
jgi:GTP-binding protein EngB required for normal cell division